MNARIALIAALVSGAAALPGYGESPSATVPGVVIDHIPAATGVYIGSPSLAVLPDGRYVASHDHFGPKTTEHQTALTAVFRSTDRGQTWQKVSDVRGAFWSSLFVHRGALYLLGPDRHYGNIVIRRSTDGGDSWTDPRDSATGLLRDNGQYHCAPMPVVEHAGRLWRAFEWRQPPLAWGINYRAGVLSAPVDADLLHAENWTATEFLPSDRAWNGRDMGGWLEGNVVVAPDGQLVNVLRVQTRSPDEKAALVRIAGDGKNVTFDPETGFIDFPGGAKKFTIRFDPQSKLYWSLASIVHEGHRAENPGSIRNTLALTCSPNLIDWTVRSILLYHPDTSKHGFQYVDWLFDGDDLIAVCRTAYDDGEGGAHNYHDANYLTFHRVVNFRDRAMADGPADSRSPSAQPDVLLIMPDQMRGDCLSILGHPAVRTPTIDQLAQQGVLFRRAYSTVPSCIPARYALLTGLYPRTSGVVGFRQKPVTSPTLPLLLRDAGYSTVLVGRDMHQAASAQELGYQTAVRGSTYVGDDEYAADLLRAVPEAKGIREWVAGLGLDYNLWPARPWPLSGDLHPTAWVVGKARAALAEAATDRPLFLTASFYAPHPPLFPPQEYFDALLERELPAAARGDWVDWDSLTPQGADGGHRVLLEGETLRRAQAGYFGLIEHLDRQIGPLIADFRARSEKVGRPWVIAFTTDHGEMLGDHGYFRKCEPFEGSASIPLILAASRELGFRAATRCSRPVCLEDLLPTLLELAETPCPKVDGVSLVPVLRGPDREIRPWLHFEHADCYSRQQAFHALTDGRVKYVWRPYDGEELLFDLEQDPREERNLAQVADWRTELEQWRDRLVQRLAGQPEGFSDGTRLIPDRPYPPLHKQSAPKAARPRGKSA